MRYAAETSVSSEKSKGEIEATLRRYGADQFGSMWEDGRAAIQFRIKSKMVRFNLPLPDQRDDEFAKGGCIRAGWHDEDPTHLSHSRGCFAPRPPEVSARLWEQACRQRWRALALAIKAKLEAVECGITTFEEEFLSHLVVPGQKGKTVGQMIISQIESAYVTGKTPSLGWEEK
ncbi:MAG: hypothetical protein KGZ65_04070 [Sphingomonadales bacterium]|nr:hypothetical protein [Sphingomonadaceae bacterium]MBS3930389.1 hypothetical protein [Sphingomonadales bacterium]